jgi:hypothetical protein
MTLSNKHKKDIIRFVLAGTAALLIKKFEGLANKKAEEAFPDDKNSSQEN